MLGGSIAVALIRFVINISGVVILFSLMSEPRYSLKKTAVCYACLCVVMAAVSCVWYAVNQESYVRLAPLLLYLCFAVFSIFMNSDPIYLCIYKLTLTFYLMAVFMIIGIEVSIIFFARNIWIDITARILSIFLMAVFINTKIKSSIRGFGYYVEHEVDRFSVIVMIICILSGIGYVLSQNGLEQTPYRLYQIVLNFLLTGALQLLVFRLYLHTGKEKEYQKENQLIQMNQRLLERHMELLESSVETGRRIRHDARHHNAVIAEYARRGQDEELLQYLKEYLKETDTNAVESICANTAVNNLLAAYTERAKKEHISVSLDVKLEKNPGIPSIDLVTILANAYENAIYGCMEVQKHARERACSIHLMIRKKLGKLIIYCSNTCRTEIELKNGLPKPETTGGIGVLSIIKTAEKYDGEYDFKNDNGMFIFRLIINLPPERNERSC